MKVVLFHHVIIVMFVFISFWQQLLGELNEVKNSHVFIWTVSQKKIGGLIELFLSGPFLAFESS